MADFHFIRPYFLFAFIPLILSLFLLFNRSRQGQAWSKICDAHLLQHLLVNVGGKARLASVLLMALVGSVMVVSLAGPSFTRLPQTSFSQQQARVIVLEVSSNMLGQDIPPNRLQRAKFKIEDLLQQMQEGQVGLVVFTQEPFLVSPLTTDSDTLKLMLSELSTDIMPVDGSDIAPALTMAGKLIEQGGYPHGQIYLLSAAKVTDEDIGIAKTLAKKGITTSVIGLASKLGAPVFSRGEAETISRLDESGFKKLAKAGKGVYSGFTSSDQDIKTLLKQGKPLVKAYKKEKTQLKRWKDQGRYLLCFILPLVLLGFRRGWLESIA